MKKRTEYTNEKTGEVYYSDNSYCDNIFTEEGYLFWCQKSQSRQFRDVPLPNISYEAKGIFADMCRHYLKNGDNLLEVKDGRAWRPFTLKDLSVMLGKSDKQTKRWMNLFLSNRMVCTISLKIGEETREWFVVNPLYYIAGKRLTYTMYKLFKKELDEYLNENVKAELSNIIETQAG